MLIFADLQGLQIFWTKKLQKLPLCLAETYDSCTAVLRYYPRAAAALTLAKK